MGQKRQMTTRKHSDRETVMIVQAYNLMLLLPEERGQSSGESQSPVREESGEMGESITETSYKEDRRIGF